MTLFLEFWKFFYFGVLLLYLGVILFETYRKTRRKLNYFFSVYFLLIVGTIIPGFAQLMELLRIKIDTSKFYRNFNDI